MVTEKTKGAMITEESGPSRETTPTPVPDKSKSESLAACLGTEGRKGRKKIGTGGYEI